MGVIILGAVVITTIPQIRFGLFMDPYSFQEIRGRRVGLIFQMDDQGLVLFMQSGIEAIFCSTIQFLDFDAVAMTFPYQEDDSGQALVICLGSFSPFLPNTTQLSDEELIRDAPPIGVLQHLEDLVQFPFPNSSLMIRIGHLGSPLGPTL